MDEDMVDHCIEKGGIGAWAYARVYIGSCRCPRKSRIDVDKLRPILLSLPDPLESHGVVLGHIAAFHQNGFAMLQVNPVIGHCTPPKRCPQTGDGRAVSKSRLVF